MNANPLRTDGYYYSGAVLWEDWHAGVHMRETHFHYWRFFANRDWICCHRYTADFDFWPFSEDVSEEMLSAAKRGHSPQIEGGLQTLIAGTYDVTGDLVIANYEYWVPLHPDGHNILRAKIRWRVIEDALEPAGDDQPVGKLSFTVPSL